MSVKETRKNGIFLKLILPDVKKAIEDKKWHLIKSSVSEWEPADIAFVMKQLDMNDALVFLRLLPPDLQSESLAKLDIDLQRKILKNLTNEHVRSIISELDPDDRTEIFEDINVELKRRLLNLLSPEDRQETLQLLGYPKESVGRLMTPDYVAVKDSWTIKKALNHIREWGQEAETIDMIYVVDNSWVLLDDIPIKKLIIAQPDETIKSLMDRHVISINANEDQETAANLMEKYDLVSLPVVDDEKHLLGIVTVDDVIDVIREEQTEDITRISGVEGKEVGLNIITDIKNASIKKLYRSRITWLITLLIMDLATGGILQGFEKFLAKYVVLITFLPVLVDTAGNTGSQAAVLTIRAMALGKVRMKDWIYMLGKEFVVSGLLGLTMGIGISFMGFIRGKSFAIARVVIIAMVVNVVIGGLIGAMLPFIFTKAGRDPAAASTPLITTLSDIIGTGVYMVIAYTMLR